MTDNRKLTLPPNAGSNGQSLTTDGSGNLSFSTISGDSVTLASVTDNYLSISGQEITSGIVPVSLGGTGQTSYTDGQLLIGNTSTNPSIKPLLLVELI